MNDRIEWLKAFGEIEQKQYLEKCSKDAVAGALALCIQNLGIGRTLGLLEQHKQHLSDFDPLGR